MAVQSMGGLRVARAYRSVPGPAVLVIQGIISINLLAAERKRIFVDKEQGAYETIARQEKKATLHDWEHQWRTGKRGKWSTS